MDAPAKGATLYSCVGCLCALRTLSQSHRGDTTAIRPRDSPAMIAFFEKLAEHSRCVVVVVKASSHCPPIAITAERAALCSDFSNRVELTQTRRKRCTRRPYLSGPTGGP
eukprot:scaffold228993_cov31-Tisochrysis_lutea.AAC.1